MPNRLSRSLALAAVAVAVPAAAAGCGSSSNNNTAANPATTTATKAATAASGTVAVSLGENGGKMFITPSPTSAPAGKVTFNVKNDGQLVHEMVVIKTDKDAGDLAKTKGGEADETGSVGEVADLGTGKSKSLTLNLKKGHYALVCNITGHYAMGMYSNFTVS